MNTNLDLWSKVEKTNPKYTKKANVKGNHITSIAPQYQILNATEQFGSYGSTWGFKNMSIDYTLIDKGLVTFKALFYYPNGEFETINSIQLYRDNAMTKIDDNFAKKLETDTLTKALSKLGFNADIFLGKFDDTRYVDSVSTEFAQKEIQSNVERLNNRLESCTTIEQLATTYKSFTKAEKAATVAKKDEMKLKLNNNE